MEDMVAEVGLVVEEAVMEIMVDLVVEKAVQPNGTHFSLNNHNTCWDASEKPAWAN